MYVIVEISKKQYRVSENQILEIEKLDKLIDSIVVFNQVIMLVDDNNYRIGRPFLDNVHVVANVIFHGYSKKVVVVKFRRRKHFRKLQGHRQQFTRIKINSITIE